MNQQFNSTPSTWMHIDLNSCFATIEQQANPHLRGRPIAVAAYTTPRGCILAPSVEAKRMGVKTGMRVMDGRKLCPQLIILPSDPPKYRFVNRALFALLKNYSPCLSVRSIDEIVIDYTGLPILKKQSLAQIGVEIKVRIKQEIGEWLTVSVGIATNPYLAKLAAGLHKPDGLDEINSTNILKILSRMQLTDLPYIKERNALRLLCVGVRTPVDFYFATPQQLKAAFESINGCYWHLRLHGYIVDAVEWQRRSVGHSYALPRPTADTRELQRILYRLVEKMGRRLRRNHWTAQGIHLACDLNNGRFWHHGHKTLRPMYATTDLFAAALEILKSVPPKPVRTLAVSCFLIQNDLYMQMAMFESEEKKRAITQALDLINDTWGEFSVKSGLALNMQDKLLDRISFGSVRDITEVVLKHHADTYAD